MDSGWVVNDQRAAAFPPSLFFSLYASFTKVFAEDATLPAHPHTVMFIQVR
jgi:hypothetical protein